MNALRLRELFERIPFSLIFVAYMGYLGYDYYQFNQGAESPIMAKISEADTLKKENVKIQQKIDEAKKFFETLEQKKTELRSLASKLDEMKTTLSEELDEAQLLKSVITEATKTGLTVISMKPSATTAKDYYVEHVFDLSFKGFFVQLLVFLERLSSLERIVRVDTFRVRRSGPSTAPYVELTGDLQIKAYHYRGSKADELTKEPGSTSAPSNPAPAPAPVTPSIQSAPKLVSPPSQPAPPAPPGAKPPGATGAPVAPRATQPNSSGVGQ